MAWLLRRIKMCIRDRLKIDGRRASEIKLVVHPEEDEDEKDKDKDSDKEKDKDDDSGSETRTKVHASKKD